MTTLLIYAGPPLSRLREARDRLVASRALLNVAGLVVFADDDPEATDGAVAELVSGAPPRQIRTLVKESIDNGARMVLLISGGAYGPLQEPANVKRLVEFAHAENMDVQVVLIVREQLDLLNQAYCEQVMALETSDDFDTFVRQAIDSGAYDYAHAFRALLDADDVTVVAVPYSRLAADEPAQVLLREAGIDLPLPSARSPRPEPTVVGPVLVTATRLLHKRLTRLGRRVRSHRRVALSKAGNRLRAKARAHSWDDTPFWGWTPELTDVATQSFRDGNAAFAARTWNGDWPDAAPERSYTKPDLPARGAAVVVDVMDTIQAVIDKLPKHKKPSGRD